MEGYEKTYTESVKKLIEKLASLFGHWKSDIKPGRCFCRDNFKTCSRVEWSWMPSTTTELWIWIQLVGILKRVWKSAWKVSRSWIYSLITSVWRWRRSKNNAQEKQLLTSVIWNQPIRVNETCQANKVRRCYEKIRRWNNQSYGSRQAEAGIASHETR